MIVSLRPKIKERKEAVSEKSESGEHCNDFLPLLKEDKRPQTPLFPALYLSLAAVQTKDFFHRECMERETDREDAKEDGLREGRKALVNIHSQLGKRQMPAIIGPSPLS